MNKPTLKLNPLTSLKVLTCTIVIATSLTGCIFFTPKVLPQGTAAQAIEARGKYEAGIAAINLKAQQFSDLLNRYQQVPVVRKIINEPVELPILDVLSTDIIDQIGTYTEDPTAPTGFSFVAGGPDILVQYLNGVDFKMSNLTFRQDQRLGGFDLAIAGNMRNITTPQADDVGVTLKFTYPDFSQIPALKNTGGIVVGSVAFYLPGQTTLTKYNMRRRIGTLEAIGISLNSLRYHRFTDIATNTTAENVETIIYTVSDQLPGVWAGFNYSHSYTEGDLSYIISWQTNQNTLSTTGTASFMPANSVLKGLFGADVASGIVRVGYQGFEVATLRGGPVICDMTIANDPGTGTAIQLEWVDGTNEAFIPGPAFPCSRMILEIPPLL